MIISHLHPNFSKAASLGIIVLLLGVGKIAIAVGLWYRSWFMRNVGLVALSVFAIYAAWEIIQTFTAFRLVALIADLGILFYFWKILPHHLKRHGDHLEIS